MCNNGVVDDAIKLAHVTLAQFCGSVCGILALGKSLSSPKEAVADPLPKTSAVWLMEFSCTTVIKRLQLPYIGPVINNNKIW